MPRATYVAVGLNDSIPQQISGDRTGAGRLSRPAGSSDRRWPPLPACRVVVAAEVDTDRLGTFTGEVERPGPPRETALMKARLGQGATGLPCALASEGAFGPTRTRS